MIIAGKRYFVYPWCVDGRKSFNGLAGIVRDELGSDPANGEVFIFLNKTRQSIKLLFWEHGGFVIYCKKMDRGNFEAPPLRADGKGSYISEIQLLQVLRGVEFQREKLHKKRQKRCLRWSNKGEKKPEKACINECFSLFLR